MTDQGGQAKQIIALVREPSPKKRRDGLAALVQAFRSAPKGSTRELHELGEALAGTLAELTEEDRLFLAERLGNCAAAPTYLIRKLAADRPEVAAPVLAITKVLEDADLIEAAGLGGTERLVALAQREIVSAPLEVALIKSGDAAALRVLSARDDLHHPQAVAQACLRAAKRSPGLAADLVKRDTLPPALLAHLFFDLKGDARVALAAKMAIGGGSAPAPASPQTENELMSLLRAGKRGAFIRVLTKLSGLPQETLEQAIEDPTCEIMAVLTQGLGLNRAVFSSYAILTRPDESERKLTALLALPARFPSEGAFALIRAWAAKAAQGAPAPVAKNRQPPTPSLPPPPRPDGAKGAPAGAPR